MSTYQPCPVCGAIPTEYMGTAPERRDSTGKITHPAREFVRVSIVHNDARHPSGERRAPTPAIVSRSRRSNFGERDG